jgi:hypothetical protein
VVGEFLRLECRREADVVAAHQVQAVEQIALLGKFGAQVDPAVAVGGEAFQLLERLVAERRREKIMQERIRPGGSHEVRGAGFDAQAGSNLLEFLGPHFGGRVRSVVLPDVRFAAFGDQGLECFEHSPLIRLGEQELVLLFADLRQEERFEGVHLVVVPAAILARREVNFSAANCPDELAHQVGPLGNPERKELVEQFRLARSGRREKGDCRLLDSLVCLKLL